MSSLRPDRLNALAAAVSARSYLEIGVSRGSTFLRVDVARKVGVDPLFRFDAEAHAGPGVEFHRMTSDAYFARRETARERFDLIYLDGLHAFGQTFRDFCASLACAHESTVWVIDDTNPTGFAASRRSPRAARWLRRLSGSRDTSWMGDVYKVVFALHDFFPQFAYATYPGHGQTVVWRERREDFAPAWNSLARIGRLGYLGFLANRRLLNVRDEAAILASVSGREGRNDE